jgi:proliferating cell nuclear antigen
MFLFAGEIDVIGDTVDITANKEGIKFQAKGDIGSGSIMYKQETNVDDDEKSQVMVKVEKEVSLVFALRYLKEFAKATALCETVTLQMSDDVPLAVQYKIEDMGELSFFLAPKIEDSD